MTKQQTTFTFDELETLAEQLFDESEERQNAGLAFKDGVITLTTIEFKDAAVSVYQIKESDEFYNQLDKRYLSILENHSSGSDFWDMWTSVLDVLADNKIVDEVFNP